MKAKFFDLTHWNELFKYMDTKSVRDSIAIYHWWNFRDNIDYKDNLVEYLS